MKKTWVIAARELDSYYNSLMAYLFVGFFLILTGAMTWVAASNVFVQGVASLGVFFQIVYWTTFIFVPAITMRSISEELRSGTLELLSTKAITDWDIVAGKFLACFLLFATSLVLTLPYYLTISQLGEVDHGAIIGGYLGILLMGGAYISLGILASSLTSNQIVAFLIALVFGTFFFFLFGFFAQGTSSLIGLILSYLSIATHYDAISRGVIDTKDLVFFLSLAGIGLVLAQLMLSKRNWQA